jgi:predicted transcriptional regulator
MKRSPLRNFHVPLPEDLYSRLREEADRSKQPATEMARHAIEDWLEQRRRAALHEAIAAYAVRHAGSPVDLDEALEATSIEYLTEREEPAQ